MKIQLLALVAACLFNSYSGEIIIKNGVDGYEGCRDSYMTEPGGEKGPHGSEERLLVENGY